MLAEMTSQDANVRACNTIDRKHHIDNVWSLRWIFNTVAVQQIIQLIYSYGLQINLNIIYHGVLYVEFRSTSSKLDQQMRYSRRFTHDRKIILSSTLLYQNSDLILGSSSR